MKKLRVLFAITIVAIASFMVIGCQQEETRTADECMTQFAAAVNSGAWDDIKDCTSPTADNYNLMTAEMWEAAFTLGSDTFTYTISGNTATGHKDAITYYFTLVEDKKDYFSISEIDTGSTDLFW